MEYSNTENRYSHHWWLVAKPLCDAGLLWHWKAEPDESWVTVWSEDSMGASMTGVGKWQQAELHSSAHGWNPVVCLPEATWAPSSAARWPP